MKNKRRIVVDSGLLEELNYLTDRAPVAFNTVELYLDSSIGRTWHWHPAIQMSKVTAGKIKYHVRDASYILEEGDAILINMNQLHKYGNVKMDESSTFLPEASFASVTNLVCLPEIFGSPSSLSFSKYVLKIITDESRPCFIFRKSIPWQKEILDIFNRAEYLEEQGQMGTAEPAYEMEVQELLLRMWRIIYRNLDKFETQAVSKSKAVAQVRMKQMINYIESNFSEKITLDDLAAAAHISRREVARCFKENAGKTPFEYILEYRIARGKMKLIMTDETIINIALQCGFESGSYFTRVFKRIENMSPQQYRQRSKGEKKD